MSNFWSKIKFAFSSGKNGVFLTNPKSDKYIMEYDFCKFTEDRQVPRRFYVNAVKLEEEGVTCFSGQQEGLPNGSNALTGNEITLGQEHLIAINNLCSGRMYGKITGQALVISKVDNVLEELKHYSSMIESWTEDSSEIQRAFEVLDEAEMVSVIKALASLFLLYRIDTNE